MWSHRQLKKTRGHVDHLSYNFWSVWWLHCSGFTDTFPTCKWFIQESNIRSNFFIRLTGSLVSDLSLELGWDNSNCWETFSHNWASSQNNLFHPGPFWVKTIVILKVAQWKNGLKRPHNTANLNFPSLRLRVEFLLGFLQGIFVRETTQFLTTKQWLSWLPLIEKLRRT